MQLDSPRSQCNPLGASSTFPRPHFCFHRPTLVTRRGFGSLCRLRPRWRCGHPPPGPKDTSEAQHTDHRILALDHTTDISRSSSHPSSRGLPSGCRPSCHSQTFDEGSTVIRPTKFDTAFLGWVQTLTGSRNPNRIAETDSHGRALSP